MKLYFRFLLYPMTALFVLLQSCVGEDNSGCAPGSIKVYFSYLTTYGQWLVDPAEVNRVHLFVFDENGVFVGEWTDRNPEMSLTYYMELPLPYGTYQFVCWAGMDESYTLTPDPLVKKQTRMDDCLLSLNRFDLNTVAHTPNHLFYGLLPEGVVNKPQCSFTIELKKMTNTINVTTEGLENTENDYHLTIDDKNGDYDFNASLASNAALQYITPCLKDGQGQPYASLRVLVLDENRPSPVLTLKNTTLNKNVFSANLIDLILKLRKQAMTVDFDNIHTYHIHLRFAAGIGVIVTVNGWELSTSQAEL